MKEMHKREMNEEFHELDEDKSGDISWEEFNPQVEGEMSDKERKEYERNTEEEKKMFQAADKNGLNTVFFLWNFKFQRFWIYLPFFK